MSHGEGPAAPATPSAVVPAAAAEPVLALRTRRKRGCIDLDANIEKARTSMKEAAKALTRARADARNEKRKKQRLLKKAQSLTMQDLGRIAQLKNAGLWDPAHGLPDVPGAGPPPTIVPASDAAAPAASAPSTPSTVAGAASSSSAPPPGDGGDARDGSASDSASEAGGPSAEADP